MAPFSRILVAILLLPAWSAAQTPSLRSPQTGSVYDPPSRSLRAISGFVGAAYLGPARLTGLDAATVAPSGLVALVTRQETISLVRRLDQTEPEEVALPELTGPWSHVLWNGSEVWVTTAAGLSRIRSLDAAPVVDPPVELPSPPSALALQEGSVLLALSDGIYQLGEGGALALLFSLDQPCALATSPNRIFAASCSTPRLVVVSPATGAPEDLPVPATPATLTLAGAAFSAEGDTLFLAETSTSRILIFDFATGVWSESLPVDAPPSFLERLPGPSLYLLRTPTRRGEPVLVLDSRAPATVWFVPAGDLP